MSFVESVRLSEAYCDGPSIVGDYYDWNLCNSDL